MRFLRDIVLMPLPFALLSVFFFLGEQAKMGIFTALVTLAVLWYMWPRAAAAGPADSEDDASVDPQLTPHPGAGGGGGVGV